MINWENIKYDINNAKKDFDKLEVNINSIEPIDLSTEFIDIRNKIISARNELYEIYNFDYANKLDYKFDILFGIKLYEILDEDNSFFNRYASNDDIWRYLSVKVLPDIVHARWEFNEAHFYKTSRRIWLKTTWWYIHLSWQNDSNMTYEILKNNSTDTILQLVERPGIGYNIELYREIMKQYSLYEDPSRNLFRKVLKVNTAKLLTTSPELVNGGIKNYVSSLFEAVKR